MVNFRHTDNVSSRGWEAKSAKGRTFSIPPESIGEVRRANFKHTRRHKQAAINDPWWWFNTLTGSTQNSNSYVSAIFARLMRLASKLGVQVPRSISGQTAFYPGAGFTKRRLPFRNPPLRWYAHENPALTGRGWCGRRF